MKNKSDLFQLIQSMSKTEKRYFSMDAKKSGRRSSRYFELFQAINAMEVYEESKLQRQFGRSLPTDKHYLYEAILRSIRDYRSSKSKSAQIRAMVLDATYLYERGLYQQSADRLAQAKSLADELDDQLALLDITREQLNYVWNMKRKDFSEQIGELLEDKDRYIKNINEELQYLALAYRIQMAKQSAAPQQAKEELAGAHFEESRFPDSAHAQRRFLQSAALHADLQDDFDTANAYYTRMVDWWDQYPNIKREEYVRYLADLFNLLHASYYQKHYQQFKDILRKIEGEQPSNYHDQQLIFKQLTNYQLLYHINLGVMEGHEQLLERVEQGMASYKLNPVSSLIIAFNVTVLLFILERYDTCQDWAGRVIKEYNRQVDNATFRLSTLLIILLAAYSDDDLDRFDTAARALQRAIRNHEKADFFSLCLKRLRKINSAPLDSVPALLSRFAEAVRETAATEDQRAPLGMDDLVLNWLESRQQGRALYLVFREQAGVSSHI
jgi:hypothetical protein